jgi:Ser/Thr protein kinase RdoA (MazF antagonist)
MLYEWLPGELRKKPEYPVEEVAAALARLHAAQTGPASDLSEAFRFDETCMIWLPAFERYRTMQWDDAEIASAIAGLSAVAAWHHAGENRDMLYARSPSVHCHGDVTPKNVILGTEGPGFFDFNNAFFGPRMADVIDGAFEFSLAEQYFHLADFRRFDAFVSSYSAAAPANEAETQDLGRWIELIGIIKFAKELRVMLQKPSNESLRRSRALAIAGWVLGKRGAV